LQYFSGINASGNNWTTAAPKTPGTYTVLATFQGSTDYGTASASTTFMIAPSAPTLSVPALKVNDAGGTYNGAAFVASATVSGRSSLEGVTPTLTYYKGTTALSGAPSAVGGYTVVASFAGSADYASAASSMTFAIAQAAPSVTVRDSGGTANGSTSFPATATVSGVASQSTPAPSLEGVAPTLEYFAGTTASGNNWTTAAPKAVGTYTVLATFQGSADYSSASAHTTFTLIADPVITATSGSGQIGPVETQFPQAFSVTVVDVQGNPIGGAAVTFTAPSSGASGVFAGGLTSVVVETSANGKAMAPAFTANDVAGSYSVIASTPGASVSAVFTLTNQAVVTAAVATTGQQNVEPSVVPANSKPVARNPAEQPAGYEGPQEDLKFEQVRKPIG
jgi:hypothetical protein